MAVDPEKRALLAKALSDLIEGRITNTQFIDASRAWESADPAVRAIGEHFSELCFDEREYRFAGDDALGVNARSFADRCRLFLQTDQAYEWPEAPSTTAHALATGAAIFLLLPLGLVLLIAAAVLATPALALAGLVCLALSGLLLWSWSRREDTPARRAYWASGDRDAWPFLRRADYHQAQKTICSP